MLIQSLVVTQMSEVSSKVEVVAQIEIGEVDEECGR